MCITRNYLACPYSASSSISSASLSLHMVGRTVTRMVAADMVTRMAAKVMVIHTNTATVTDKVTVMATHMVTHTARQARAQRQSCRALSYTFWPIHSAPLASLSRPF